MARLWSVNGPRIAFAIPITPWPVLIWIARQEGYPWSRHWASALHAVTNQALLLCLSTTFAGLLALLLTIRVPKLIAIWALFATANAMALWTYIDSNSYVLV